MKRGSIELARRLCAEIARPSDYLCEEFTEVDIAEILSAEVERQRVVIARMVAAKQAEDEPLVINFSNIVEAWAPVLAGRLEISPEAADATEEVRGMRYWRRD